MIEYVLSRQPLIFESRCVDLLLHQGTSNSSIGCSLAVISDQHGLIRIVYISCLIEWSQHLLFQLKILQRILSAKTAVIGAILRVIQIFKIKSVVVRHWSRPIIERIVVDFTW